MGLFSLFKRKKQVPFETTLHLSIPLDDDDLEDLDETDLNAVLSKLDISLPDGITIDQVGVSARVKRT